MKYLFGPVLSRRLGRSLGIDLIPGGICSFNCVYCEVGRKSRLTCDREEFTPVEDILAEIDAFLADGGRRDVDILTITATGEPTLHADLGRVIRHVRRAGLPCALLTNSTLMHLPDVQADLEELEVLIPSVDAVRGAPLKAVNRPAGCVDMEAALAGLAEFSHRFGGRVLAEVLLVEGLNDGRENLEDVLEVLGGMRLDRVQLNTVARPPLEDWARPLGRARLEEAARRIEEALGPGVPVDIPMPRPAGSGKTARTAPSVDEAGLRAEIEELLHRRPCTLAEVAASRNIPEPLARRLLDELGQAGRITTTEHGGRIFFQAC